MDAGCTCRPFGPPVVPVVGRGGTGRKSRTVYLPHRPFGHSISDRVKARLDQGQQDVGRFGTRRRSRNPVPADSRNQWVLRVGSTIRTLIRILRRWPFAPSSSMVLRAGELRCLGMEIVSRPLDDDPGHCEIAELTFGNRKSMPFAEWKALRPSQARARRNCHFACLLASRVVFRLPASRTFLLKGFVDSAGRRRLRPRRPAASGPSRGKGIRLLQQPSRRRVTLPARPLRRPASPHAAIPERPCETAGQYRVAGLNARPRLSSMRCHSRAIRTLTLNQID